MLSFKNKYYIIKVTTTYQNKLYMRAMTMIIIHVKAYDAEHHISLGEYSVLFKNQNHIEIPTK